MITGSTRLIPDRTPISQIKAFEGELRIFVIGGSTVFNGAPLEKTIRPDRIRTTDAVSRAKVSLGIVAVSGQELALLTHLLVDYAPDFVISWWRQRSHSPYQYESTSGLSVRLHYCSGWNAPARGLRFA
jgi:hypothetical protein